MTKKLILIIAAVLIAATAQAADPTDKVGISTTAPGLILWDTCGWEGAPACSLANPIFTGVGIASSLFFSASGGCDLTLRPDSHGICVDAASRATVGVPDVYVAKWLQSQQSDQFNRISADLPLHFVPIMGTHNSYSNGFDGGSDILNLDQHFDITDQLNLGARMIRLDPVVNYTGTSVMGCHMSPFDDSFKQAVKLIGIPVDLDMANLCATQFTVGLAPWLNGNVSYQRPIYLAVQEIKHWLQQHPGEVVLITVNNFIGSGSSGYISVDDLEAIFKHVLGDMVVTPGEGDWERWPTLRQIRSLNHQAVLMFADTGGTDAVFYDDGYVWHDISPITHSNYNSTSDGFFGNCQDYDGNDVGVRRDTNKREDIGEDRAFASVGTSSLENGEMTWLTTAISAACGFSSVSFDFLYGLNYAPKVTFPGFGSIDYEGGGYFYSSASGLDERPRWLIWSWLHDADLSTSTKPAAIVHQTSLNTQDTIAHQAFQQFGATQNWMTYRWQQFDTTASMPYACGGPGDGSFPDFDNTWDYNWAITTGVGNFHHGEEQCQAEFGSTYHFWRPMSGLENRNLTGIMANQFVDQVWVNHFSGATEAQPKNISLTYGTANSKKTASIVLSSGFGGALSFSFQHGPLPNFIKYSQPFTGSNLYYISVDDTAVAGRTDNLNGTVVITEQHPDGSPATTALVEVSLTYNNLDFTGDKSGVNFISSNTQTVALSSSPQNIGFTYDQTQTPAWLSISFDRMATPATMTVKLNPASAPAFGIYVITLNPNQTGYPTLTIPVSVITTPVTIDSNPAGVFLNIDGTSTLPGTFNWVVGSSHQVSAPASFIPHDGEDDRFQDWTTVAFPPTITTASTLNLTASAAPMHFRADFTQYFRLDLSVSPQPAGTLTADQPPAFSNMYAAGTQLNLTATAHTNFLFKNFNGTITGQQSPAPLTMNGASSVTAVFTNNQFQTTFNTNPAGLNISVDGKNYSTPISFPWATNESHIVDGPIQSTGATGTRYAFDHWGDVNNGSPRTFANLTSAGTFTLNFALQYQVTTLVSPTAAGTLTGAGWYAPNATVTLQATPAQGFNFSSYSNGVNSTNNPFQFTITAPVQANVNFAAAKPPILFASAGARVDLGNGVIQLPIVLNDLATAGPAGDAVISSITVSGTPTGSSAPTFSFPASGQSVGTIFPGMSGQITLNVTWPTSATRVTFNIKYTANGLAYQSGNSITLFR